MVRFCCGKNWLFFRWFGTVEKKLESSKQKIMVNFPDKLGEKYTNKCLIVVLMVFIGNIW